MSISDDYQVPSNLIKIKVKRWLTFRPFSENFFGFTFSNVDFEKLKLIPPWCNNTHPTHAQLYNQSFNRLNQKDFGLIFNHFGLVLVNEIVFNAIFCKIKIRRAFVY